MSLTTPCSVCGKKQKGRDASVTTAWYDVESTRHAWRQRMCIGCFAQSIVPLQVASEGDDLTCPLCHIDTSNDMDPTFLTLFVPGAGQINLELPTDPACAAIIRVRAQVGGYELENRPVGGPGSWPSNSSSSAWDELGLGKRTA